MSSSPHVTIAPKPAALAPSKVARHLMLAAATMGLVGYGASQLTIPAYAEVTAGATVETPFGRAPVSFADLVDRVKPSVVSVSVKGGGEPKVAERDGQPGERGFPMPDLPENHPLYDFFKNLPKDFGGGGNNSPSPRPAQAQGSGFVISADGYVITNNHVIDGASKIEVSFDEDSKFEATLVGTDQRTDIALLKIKTTKESKPFPFVKLSTKAARVGDWAIAVGNPFGLGGTVTAGIVSALARDIGSGPYDYLQIDAAVNRGNSGGPTFNLDGDVIGVNTAIYSPSGGNVGIAFAVPAKTVDEVVKQLREKGTVSRGWLGVKIQNVDDDTAASLGLKEAKGALVSEVTPQGPAAAAGLKAQDAILQVNADRIDDSRDLARKIAEYAPDTPVDVTIWRGNGEQTVKVKLGTFPSGNPEAPQAPKKEPEVSKLDLDQLGVTLMPARAGGKTEGVVIAEVDPNSDAAQKGIKAGDIILEVSGLAVATPEEVASGLKKAQDLKRSAVLLHIKSADQTRFVAVQMKKQG